VSTPKRSPLIIGHRGASSIAPENTLAAFARALQLGADGIELDIRLARDGVPVVIHDPTLKRTGSRRGSIGGMTSTQLGQIDVGSWFNRKHSPSAQPQLSRETIPTLEQVLQLMADESRQDTIVYIELKTGRSRDEQTRLAASVVELITRYGFAGRVIVISFNLKAVALVKMLDSSIRTGALFGPRQRALKSTRRIVAEAARCNATEILLHHSIATREMIAQARAKSLAPVVWTVDDLKWLARARDLGIHALMTNDPEKFIGK